MPRLDHRRRPATAVSADTQMVLAVLVAELNTLRKHVDLPPLTGEEMQQKVQAYHQAHPDPRPTTR
jgi:hypothetical protein